MERQANSEGVGAVTMADHGRTIKRFTPGRIMFGEVRGPEVIDMLEGMTQGIAGSMCTIHADSSISVFPRLPIYARASGRDWTSADVLQLAAMALDLIVFVSRDRTKRRVVSEVRYVHGFDQQTRAGHHRRMVRPGHRRSRRAEPVGADPRADSRRPCRPRVQPIATPPRRSDEAPRRILRATGRRRDLVRDHLPQTGPGRRQTSIDTRPRSTADQTARDYRAAPACSHSS